ncbi:MAG: hypothetical protein NTW21_13275 [Verrucomicrobia bacterium]|nr:hypothetical protein [Verrucomicrobiota bacterium]
MEDRRRKKSRHLHPTNRADLRNPEFIEIYNSQPWSEDISGYEITDATNYRIRQFFC